jgi:uncharacterized protein (UPF0548 family)
VPIFLYKPSVETINAFLVRQYSAPFSYTDVGRSRTTSPPGYVVDHRRLCLGRGQEVFDAACTALRGWAMFQLGWVELYRTDTPIAPDAIVAVLVYWRGLRWLNANRIIYVLDETDPMRRFGFAYGTLLDHAERGEERFSVEWREDDTVWYDLFAFSRPRHLLARLGYPLARRLQQRFGTDSLAAMARAVPQSSPHYS